MDLFSLLCLVGIFSCVSVIYSNSRKNTRQLDEIIGLLKRIAEKP